MSGRAIDDELGMTFSDPVGWKGRFQMINKVDNFDHWRDILAFVV
jgi:hypothetical protein